MSAKTVWIGYTDNGCEGCSLPIKAFTSQATAELWKSGADDCYGSGASIIELPLIDVKLIEEPKP